MAMHAAHQLVEPSLARVLLEDGVGCLGIQEQKEILRKRPILPDPASLILHLRCELPLLILVFRSPQPILIAAEKARAPFRLVVVGLNHQADLPERLCRDHPLARAGKLAVHVNIIDAEADERELP